MATQPPIHEELFGMAQARRDREGRRDEERRQRGRAASGERYPTADELLRGYPLLGENIRHDIRMFVAKESLRLSDPAALESLQILAHAAQEVAEGSGCAGVLTALRACRLSPEADPDGSVRLRCVLYAALLGDVDAAQAVAAEAALAAYVQDWHLEGDGSDLVWQAAAWSAYAAACVGTFRQLPYKISEMDTVRERVDAFADEFRLKVGRLLIELG